MSKDDKAMTRELDDRRVAAKANTDRLTIIMTDFENQFKNVVLSIASGQWAEDLIN